MSHSSSIPLLPFLHPSLHPSIPLSTPHPSPTPFTLGPARARSVSRTCPRWSHTSTTTGGGSSRTRRGSPNSSTRGNSSVCSQRGSRAPRTALVLWLRDTNDTCAVASGDNDTVSSPGCQRAGGRGRGGPTYGSPGAAGGQIQRLEDVTAELEAAGPWGQAGGQGWPAAPAPSRPLPVPPGPSRTLPVPS